MIRLMIERDLREINEDKIKFKNIIKLLAEKEQELSSK